MMDHNAADRLQTLNARDRRHALSNRHPADELADIRTERKRLEEREQELRDVLLADGATLEGNDWSARLLQCDQYHLSRPMLEKRFGKQAIRECLRVIPITVIQLEQRKNGRKK
jgi:hypothetical protein